MTPDEWVKIAETVPRTWPRFKFGNEEALAWFKALRDLDGGYVALALARLATRQVFAPALAEVRSIAATEQANARRGELLKREEERPTGPYLTFSEWRRQGCPGLEVWGLTVERVDELFPRGYPDVVRTVEELAEAVPEIGGAA